MVARPSALSLARTPAALASSSVMPSNVRSLSSTPDRPMSPHVTIYAFPLAAIASITHRVTGVALCVGVYGIGFGALAGMDVAGAMACLGASSIGPLAKFAVAFPLSYHYLGGVRHIYWERNPAGLSPDTQRQSSIALIAATGVISGGLMFV